jgi:cytochrome c-type biogenesis protein CcmH/NrfG
MSLGPILYYFIGAGSALIAMLLLFPLEPGMARRGVGSRVGAAAILVLPAVLTLLAAQARAPAADQVLAIPSPPPAAVGAGGMKEDADWAMITHAFMGGPPPGAAAAAPAQAAGDATQRAQTSVAELEAVTRREPGNVEAWLALGRAHRMAREFAPAATAYETALKLDSRNADAWADYADSLASANGRSLAGKPAKAIDRALQLNPNHLKALWLAASLDLEQHHYKEAVGRWQKLRSVLPDGSPDVSIIEANIAEARQLAGQTMQASSAR